MIDEVRPAELALELLTLARVSEAEKTWKSALDEALALVISVSEKHPKKSLKQILQFKYLRKGLSDPFAKAGAHTSSSIYKAWAAQARNVDVDTSDLSLLVQDATRNAAEMPAAFRAVLLNTDRDHLTDELKKLAREYTRRAGFGVRFASQRANALRMMGNASEGSTKMWWGPPWPGQCSRCASLHGTALPINEEFQVADSSFSPYGGRLMAPPVHPRCRCRLRIIPAGEDLPEA